MQLPIIIIMSLTLHRVAFPFLAPLLGFVKRPLRAELKQIIHSANVLIVHLQCTNTFMPGNKCQRKNERLGVISLPLLWQNYEIANNSQFWKTRPLPATGSDLQGLLDNLCTGVY